VTGNFPAVALHSRDGALEATFLPSLGMVCSSLRHDGEELLEQRDGPEAYAERGSTFAIPLLHPFANRLFGFEYEVGGQRVTIDRDSPLVHIDGPTGWPIHGLLAASPHWALREPATPQRIEAELDFGAHPDLLALFPFPHRLEFVGQLDVSRLRIRLTVTPTSERPVPISFGFHPWLTLPGSAREGWSIEMPVRGHDLSGPLGDRTYDDPFEELTPSPVFAVADTRRRIAVEFGDAYTVAQVYAPQASQFICFEPMTAPVDALRSGRGLRWAQPGAPFSAEFAVSVSSP
jgi:galactose mutarotase-like enzyme